MRRLAALFALVVLAAGCGGGSHATKLVDVEPCLSKLALVVANKRFPNQTVDADNADISYAAGSAGATAAHLTFYAHPKDARAQMRLTKQALAVGTIASRPAPELVNGDVVVGWSSPPAPIQRGRLIACLG